MSSWLNITQNLDNLGEIVRLFSVNNALWAIIEIGSSLYLYPHDVADTSVSWNTTGTLLPASTSYNIVSTAEDFEGNRLYIANTATGEVYYNISDLRDPSAAWDILPSNNTYGAYLGIDAEIQQLKYYNRNIYLAHKGGVSVLNVNDKWDLIGSFEGTFAGIGKCFGLYSHRHELYVTVAYGELGAVYKYIEPLNWELVGEFPENVLPTYMSARTNSHMVIACSNIDQNIFTDVSLDNTLAEQPRYFRSTHLAGVPTSMLMYAGDSNIYVTCSNEGYEDSYSEAATQNLITAVNFIPAANILQPALFTAWTAIVREDPTGDFTTPTEIANGYQVETSDPTEYIMRFSIYSNEIALLPGQTYTVTFDHTFQSRALSFNSETNEPIDFRLGKSTVWAALAGEDPSQFNWDEPRESYVFTEPQDDSDGQDSEYYRKTFTFNTSNFVTTAPATTRIQFWMNVSIVAPYAGEEYTEYYARTVIKNMKIVKGTADVADVQNIYPEYIVKDLNSVPIEFRELHAIAAPSPPDQWFVRFKALITEPNPEDLTGAKELAVPVLTATAGEEFPSIALAWSISEVEDFSEYRIYRNDIGNVTTDSTLITTIINQLQTTYVDVNLETGKRFYYKIYVYDTDGNRAESNEIWYGTFYEDPPDEEESPTAPILISTAVTENSISLQWSGPVSTDDLKEYKIYRSTSTSSLPEDPNTLIATITDSNLSYIDANLTADTIYWYRVFIHVNNGLSTGSNVIWRETGIDTTAPPPVILSVEDIDPNDPSSTTQIKLSWTPSSEVDFDNYKLYRSDTAEWEPSAATLKSTIPWRIQTSFRDVGLIADTSYYYKVYVQDNVGNTSLASNTVMGTTNSIMPDPDPQAPILTCIGATTDSVTLAWAADIVANFSNYRIYRSLEPTVNQQSTLITTITDATTVDYIDSTVTSDVKYYYVIYLEIIGGTIYGSNVIFCQTAASGNEEELTEPTITLSISPENSVISWEGYTVPDSFYKYRVYYTFAEYQADEPTETSGALLTTIYSGDVFQYMHSPDPIAFTALEFKYIIYVDDIHGNSVYSNVLVRRRGQGALPQSADSNFPAINPASAPILSTPEFAPIPESSYIKTSPQAVHKLNRVLVTNAVTLSPNSTYSINVLVSRGVNSVTNIPLHVKLYSSLTTLAGATAEINAIDTQVQLSWEFSTAGFIQSDLTNIRFWLDAYEFDIPLDEAGNIYISDFNLLGVVRVLARNTIYSYNGQGWTESLTNQSDDGGIITNNPFGLTQAYDSVNSRTRLYCIAGGDVYVWSNIANDSYGTAAQVNIVTDW